MALATAVPAFAQTASELRATAPSREASTFLSRFAFHVGLEHLSSDDPRFVWDAHWGGELDFIDYGRGALTFLATYQTILGDEFREFDPNQGNYTLGGSGSVRAGAVEVAGVFHHVSRHLSDRPKRFPVDWNMIGGRVRSAAWFAGAPSLQAQVDVRGVIAEVVRRLRLGGGRRTPAAEVRLTAARRARRRSAAFACVGVDGSRDRGDQYGWRSDGAIRLDGRAAALELFVAGERRIDPYQLEFSTVTWLTTGFRLVSR